jgi:hypothetical protein
MLEKTEKELNKEIHQALTKKESRDRDLSPSSGSVALRKSDNTPAWLVFLAYLAYLYAVSRATRPTKPQFPYDVTGLGQLISALRLFVVIVGLVLIVVALVAVGASEEVVEVVSQWPIIP